MFNRKKVTVDKISDEEYEVCITKNGTTHYSYFDSLEEAEYFIRFVK